MFSYFAEIALIRYGKRRTGVLHAKIAKKRKVHRVWENLALMKKKRNFKWMGTVAKSYMRKGFLIYDEMRKYLVLYEEAVSHI